MPDHYQLTDIEFEQQFKNASLDPQLFNHEAHLRLAWIHVNKYGVERAVQNITRQLRNYTEALGFVEKYLETVTVAAIRAVNHFVSKSSADCFKGFIAENCQLKISYCVSPQAL